MAHRFKREGEPGHSNGVLTDAQGSFAGSIVLYPDRLSVPLKRKKPTVYAVWNDLFHGDVPEQFRDQAYSVMFCASQHTIIVLTKRPEEMQHYLNSRPHDSLTPERRIIKNELGWDDCPYSVPWPLPNVYHGLTVCNQQEADEKIPIFLQVPGKKFLSIEPCLGEIDLQQSFYKSLILPESEGFVGIDAVILGGENGAGARPMHPDWVRAVRDQCAAAGVLFFFKQWGEWTPNCLCDTKNPHAVIDRPLGKPGVMFRCGRKSKESRRIDGRTHDDLPWRKS